MAIKKIRWREKVSDTEEDVFYPETDASNVIYNGGTVAGSLAQKLDKMQFQWNKTISFGSSGILYIGRFRVYDTNITVDIASTTSVTYNGRLIVATQNNVIKQAAVYNDAANTIAPNIYIKPSAKSDHYIEVYFKPASWSKNIIQIMCQALESSEAPTHICENISAVPSTATVKPVNMLQKNYATPSSVENYISEISADASVTNTVGTPSVVVTKGGTSSAPVFNFAFENLKGATGATGNTGTRGMAVMRYAGALSTGTTSISKNNLSGDAANYSTYYIGEQIIDNSGNVFVVQATTSSSTIKVAYKFNIKGPKGDKGDTPSTEYFVTTNTDQEITSSTKTFQGGSIVLNREAASTKTSYQTAINGGGIVIVASNTESNGLIGALTLNPDEIVYTSSTGESHLSFPENSNGTLATLSDIPSISNCVTFTKNNSVSVAGTTKATYKYNQTAIFALNGLIMGGTAAAAGLVTRGVCGVTTPNATTGSCNKENLYINYDGDSTYRSNRQLVLQAGSIGAHYGNNVYQFCAVRGDALKGYVDAKVSGQVKYLGTVSSQEDLDALTPDSKGDFARVAAAFGSYHASDMLICETVKTSTAAATWSVIHGEIDSNTWVANSKAAAGYVAAGGSNANKVWKTDASGNPAWRDDKDTIYTLPKANADTLGGIKPWTYNSTASTGMAATFGDAVSINGRSSTAGRYYGVEADVNGRAYVNVPWSNTTYAHATSSQLGLLKPWFYNSSASTGVTAASYTGSVTVNARSTTAGRFYAVEMDVNGRAYVNVPWVSGTSDNFVTTNTTQTISAQKTFSDVIFGSNADGLQLGTSGYIKRRKENYIYSITVPDKSGTFALTSDLDDYVTKETEQTVSGKKTFSNTVLLGDQTDGIQFNGQGSFITKYNGNSSYTITIPNKSGTIAFTSDIPSTTTSVTSGSSSVLTSGGAYSNLLRGTSLTNTSTSKIIKFSMGGNASVVKIVGGIYSFTASNDGTYTVSFPSGVGFSGVPIVVVDCLGWYNSSYACQIGITNRTTSGFTFRISGSTIKSISWIAYGV